METTSILVPPATVINRPSDWTVQDWGVIFSVTLAIGSVVVSYFLSRSKSQAEELDRLTIEKATEFTDTQSSKLEKMMERLDKSVGSLDSSVKTLGDKITGLTERIAVVETKQQVADLVLPSYDRQFNELRSRQDAHDRHLLEIRQQQTKISAYLKSLTETIGNLTK
jgi:predicted  nucleic acid-binding Zn-ribbon protein